MPLRLGTSLWSDMSREELAAIREHAASKAGERIPWDDWMRKDGGMGFDIPFSVGDRLADVLENLCDFKRGFKLCLVPYRFDVNLTADLPPPVEFWKDELHPEGWEEARSLTVIEALWVHTRWYGSVSDDYLGQAERYFRDFDEVYDRWRLKSDGETPVGYDEELDRAAYHYIEVSLIKCLGYGIDQGLPVVIS